MDTTRCNHCGSTQLTWDTSIVSRSDVQQGRLNTRDVECVFYLGCDECSEMVAVVPVVKIAQRLNDMGIV